MQPPKHTLNLYQKPKAGNAAIDQLPVYNYQHSIKAVGGFDTASFDIGLRSVSEMEEFLDQYLGNRGAIFVDNPVEPAWEGFINRMSFTAGGVQYTISLDEMANRVTVTYTDVVGSATGAQITAPANDTASQAVWGIKQENIDFGYLRSGTGGTSLRDTVIAQKAWPKSSITRGQGEGLLHIEMLGFYHTLEWGIYTNTSTAAASLSGLVGLLLAAEVNGTTFFDSGDTSLVTSNLGVTINQEHIKRETFWAVYQRVQELGDGASYWVVGITPTLFATGTRRLYYRPASTAIKYTARKSDRLVIRNVYGQPLPPWTVRPDAGVLISDSLIGWDGLGDDPASSYIQGIDYDANAQTVDWYGDDDTRSEGAWQLSNYGRPVGKRFSGSMLRRSV